MARAARQWDLALGYVGHQYDRDKSLDRFFAPAAAIDVYGRYLATVLMLPERYAAVGQTTQRIFEAVLAGTPQHADSAPAPMWCCWPIGARRAAG